GSVGAVILYRVIVAEANTGASSSAPAISAPAPAANPAPIARPAPALPPAPGYALPRVEPAPQQNWLSHAMEQQRQQDQENGLRSLEYQRQWERDWNIISGGAQPQTSLPSWLQDSPRSGRISFP